MPAQTKNPRSTVIRRSLLVGLGVVACALLLILGRRLTLPLTVHGTVLAAPAEVGAFSADPRAFVWLEGPFAPERPEELADEVEFVMQGPEQKFIPLRVGQKLRVRNDGSENHNFHLIRKGRPDLALAIPPGESTVFNRFNAPEVAIYAYTCSHLGTVSNIGVFENPYFTVSTENGQFAIRDVPPGNYRVHAYLPGAGTHSQEIVVVGWRNNHVRIELQRLSEE